jgi:hypothetical protein
MTTLVDLHQSAITRVDTLLERRMASLCLDIGGWARFEPVLFADLQKMCASCPSRQRCARDLATNYDNPSWTVWRDYCPNTAKLDMLVALQYF